MTRGSVRALPLHAVAILVLALGVAFGTWRISSATECAWVQPSSASWTVAGVRPTVPAGCPVPIGHTVTGAQTRGDSVLIALEDGSQVTLARAAPGPFVADRVGHAWSTLAFVGALFALAAYAVRRRPRDVGAAALGVFASGLLGSTFATITGLPPSAAFEGPVRWLWVANVQAVFLLSWGAMLASLLHFPAPLAPARSLVRTTWVALLIPVGAWASTVAIAWTREPTFTGWVRTSVVVQSSLTLAAILAIFVLLVTRVRRAVRSDPASVARQQVLWVAGTSLVSVGITVALWMVPELFTGAPLLPSDLIGAPGLVVVAGIAVSMLRFRLFDLDVVLTRTIVYTLLVLASLVTYLAVTAALAAVFGSVARGPFAAVGAVVVAVVANPLRVRLQRVVNRAFYGDRDEPYVALSRIAEHSADRQRPLESVAEDIRRSLRVPYAGIEPADGPPVGSGRPESTGNGVFELPIAHSGEVVGRLVLARRTRGERLSRTEHRLLGDIAREIGSRLRADRLARALQESHERIVTAREEERRSLRRTLHDEIGPTMASVALQAETVRRVLADPTPKADPQALLGEISQTASETAEALRSLAYELRPPALDDQGLVGAVRLLAEVVPGLRVEVTADGLDDVASHSLGAAVEVAAYHLVRGAVDNVARHAGATTCWVRLVREPSRLVVVVEDDGAGIPVGRPRGVGLTSMLERATELGGSCSVADREGGGTIVRAELPMGAPAAATHAGEGEGP